MIIEGAGADINVDPVLHAACSLDLQKFCRDIPPGETSRQVVRNEKDPLSDLFFRGKKSGSDQDLFLDEGKKTDSDLDFLSGEGKKTRSFRRGSKKTGSDLEFFLEEGKINSFFQAWEQKTDFDFFQGRAKCLAAWRRLQESAASPWSQSAGSLFLK